jgi:hypothetical protein
MKKIILFILVSIVFVSCKKGNSATPNNTITATIDGINYTFNKGIIDTSVANGYPLIVVGATDADSNAVLLEIETLSGVFTTTTYGLPNDTSNIAGFLVSNPISAYTNNEDKPRPPFTVTVTSLKSTEAGISIQGTFQGNIYLNGDTTQTPKVVTNGKFNFTK